MPKHLYRTTNGWWLAAAGMVAALGMFACSSSSGQSETGGHGGGNGDNGFVSDDPNPSSNVGQGGDYNGGADAGAAGGSGGAAGAGGQNAAPGDEASPERIIEEADIIQVQGNRLYALSYYSGLAVIDIGTQDKLSLLGRYRTNAQPFEMIIRDNVVLAMFSSYPIWAYSGDGGGWSVQQTSRVVALDTTNPANIQEIGVYDVPGEISDSRVVGDIFYVVSYENGYCWECDTTPNTTIISLDVSNPQAIRLVDKLSFQDQQNSYGWYKRNISVTTDRMYVSGQNWDWNAGTGHSTIEVVDISDPAGDLVKGASVPVQGQIESRWQMDEYQGVLRVVSQPGAGWGSIDTPVVETFQVVSAQQLTPLGQLTMTLPRPENLQSVRFDGTRAFAVTFQQTDPLFTLDLSDPAQPKQVGELEMPGYLYYMAPRGDRMLALGYDQSNASGSITVSLFDISDLAHPSMIQRANFGGDWGWLPEDQDRIHKAFNILDDQNLILVPYSGWDYNDTSYYCGRYTSGIQLLDFTHDSLTLRGSAPQRGTARRAFLHNDRLFAVSDEGVNTFDISNRDAPVAKASLNLAHNAVKAIPVGNKLVQISGDWWTEQAELSVFPLNDPERDQPLGTLNLRVLDTQNSPYPDTCYSYYGFVYGSTMFAQDHYVWLVWDDTYWGYYDYNNPTGRTSIAVIDVADAAHPVLVSRTDFSFRFDGWYWYDYYGYDGYYGYGAMLSAGRKAVQYGSTLVLQEYQQGSWDYQTNEYVEPGPPNLRVIDLSDPAHPTLAATIAEPAGHGHTALQLDGATVYTSHYEDVPGYPGKVRFFVDRWNIANPAAPIELDPINVPGSLVTVDAATNRILTVDYQRLTAPASDWSDCQTLWGGMGWFDYDAGECVGYRRYLRLVDVNGSQASLLDTLQLEDGWYSNPSVGSDRVFLVKYGNYYWTGNEYQGDPRNQLITLSGFQSGHLNQSPAVPLEDQYWSWNSVFAHGTKAIAMGWYPGSLAVYDTTNAAAAPQLVKSQELYGYPNDVTIVGDTAICSLGYYGVQAVSLSSP